MRVEFGLTKEMDWLFDLNGIFLSQWRWVRCDLSQDRGPVTIREQGECPAGQQRSHSGTRFIERIVTLKVSLKITGSVFWQNKWCLELLILYFGTFTYVYAVGSDGTSLQVVWMANQKSEQRWHYPMRGWESVTRVQTVISAHCSPWDLASQIGSLHSATQ